MADIRAFRGFRYDLGRAGALSDLVAPPYDVVDPTLQQALYNKSPHNAIRLELTRDEPGDTPNRDRYSRAAQTLSGWQNDHILQQDTLRTLYVVEQEFAVEGTTYRRRGFIARLRLEPFGTGRVFPHEETMSGPKEDRLKLFRATGMNLSPLFGFYPDPLNDVFSRLEPQLLPHAGPGGEGPSRSHQPALAGDGRARRRLGLERNGRQAGLHRGRASPVRDRTALPGRSPRGRAWCPTTRRRPTSR